MFEYDGDMIDCPKCLGRHPPHVQCRQACLPQRPAGRPGCLPPGTEIHLPSAAVSVVDGILSVSECLNCGFKPMRRGRTLCVNCEKERTVQPSSVSMMAREESMFSSQRELHSQPDHQSTPMARDESVSRCLNCGHTPMLPGRTVCIACEIAGVYGIKTENGYTLGNLPGGARPTAGGQLLRVEVWKPTENREEVHYFIEGTQTYVMGFNPATVPEDVVIRALKGLGYKV